MAADLQEPPELVREFFEVLDRRRCRRGDRRARGPRRSAGRRGSPRGLFWGVYRRLVQPRDARGRRRRLRLQPRCSATTWSRSTRRNSSLVGLLFWLGFRRASVPYERRRAAVRQERLDAAAQARATWRTASSRSPTCRSACCGRWAGSGCAVGRRARRRGARRAARRRHRRARLRRDDAGDRCSSGRSTCSAWASSAPTRGARSRTPSTGPAS